MKQSWEKWRSWGFIIDSVSELGVSWFPGNSWASKRSPNQSQASPVCTTEEPAVYSIPQTALLLLLLSTIKGNKRPKTTGVFLTEMISQHALPAVLSWASDKTGEFHPSTLVLCVGLYFLVTWCGVSQRLRPGHVHKFHTPSSPVIVPLNSHSVANSRMGATKLPGNL